MNSKDDFKKVDQTHKADRLHFELRQWQSNLSFMGDEMFFIDRLLNSYVFQPNTPNLFERIQDYLLRLKKARRDHAKMVTLLNKHEKSLGGILECADAQCDLGYYQRHDTIISEISECLLHFQVLKSEIFNYAGAILKKRKPKS